MKKFLTVVVVLSSLLVSSCSEKEPEPLVPYEIMEGDFLLVDFDLQGCTSIEFTDRKIVNLKGSCVLRGEKEGNATITAYYSDKESKDLDFVVTKRELKEINNEQNKKYNEELKQKIDAFVKQVEKNNYLTIESFGNSTVDKIKIRANPLYIEKNEDYDTKIITKENDMFYEYKNFDDTAYLVKDEYAKDDKDFEIKYEASSYYIDVTKMLEYVFDCEKGNIDYFNGYYFLRGRYEDCLNEEMRKMIDAEANLNSELYDLLMNSVVSMYFKFDKNEVIFGATAKVSKDYVSVTSTGSYRVRIEKFDPIVLNEDNVIIKKANTINDEYIPEVEVVDKIYVFGTDSTCEEFIKTYLKKGQYTYTEVSGREINYVSIFLFDENKNQIKKEEGLPTNTFVVPEDGMYYLCLRKSVTGFKALTISKIEE